VSGFYQHPDPNMQKAQKASRTRACTAVSTGRVRWSAEVGLHGGFVIRDLNGIDQKLSVRDAIAIHELHQAGLITRDKHGRVHLTEQKASA
jgi:hypothetical protein